MNKESRGHTLLETLLASAVLMVVAGSMALSVRVYANGQERLACRKTALLIAASEIATAERSGLTGEPGTRFVEVAGATYGVDVESTPDGAGTVSLIVTVTGPRGGPVSLERRYLIPGGS